jgi:hypothetical protein
LQGVWVVNFRSRNVQPSCEFSNNTLENLVLCLLFIVPVVCRGARKASVARKKLHVRRGA